MLPTKTFKNIQRISPQLPNDITQVYVRFLLTTSPIEVANLLNRLSASILIWQAEFIVDKRRIAHV
jgi:hypothetical protein